MMVPMAGDPKRDRDTVRGVQQRGVRIPAGLWAEIERAAEQEGVSAAEWIRTAARFRLLWEKARPPADLAGLREPEEPSK